MGRVKTVLIHTLQFHRRFFFLMMCTTFKHNQTLHTNGTKQKSCNTNIERGEGERERATTFMRWHVFYDLIKWHLFLDSTNENGNFFDNFLLDSVFSCVSQITFQRYIFMSMVEFSATPKRKRFCSKDSV